MRKDTKDRLLAKVDIDAGSECWVWRGATYPSGYGRVRVGGKTRRAHRVSYSVFRQSIPPDTCVCHLCDNRLCVNPAHLFLGTQHDNVEDMVAKGRQARGPRNGRSKLTAEDIERIRTSSGVTCHALAAQFGVSHQHISHIRRGNGWT